MNWRNIPMPPLIAARPRDARGYPILFTSYIDDAGVPDFRISDPAKRDQCFQERRCGICGNVMGDLMVMVFLGGPLAVANRCFGDPPMHPPCAEYSRLVCPWLSLNRDRHVPMGSEVHGGRVRNPPGGVENKTNLMALYSTHGYIGCRGDTSGYVFYADLPIRVVWYEQATGARAQPKPEPRPRRELPPRELRLMPAWKQIKGATS